MFKLVTRKKEASLPAKVVIDDKKKESKLESALDPFYSQGVEFGNEKKGVGSELGIVPLVQMMEKNVAVHGIIAEENKRKM